MSTPTVRVGIPWRETEDRLPAFEATKAWYERHGFEVFAADERKPQLHFSIAAARNHLVRTIMPRSDVYILSDADTIPEWGALKEAVFDVIRGSQSVHLPYHLYRHERGEFIEGACSGILVFGPQVWWSLSGQDENFRGWGFEDTAFRFAHETLVGPMIRHKGTVIAASHADARRDRLSVNRRRFQYYRSAYGQPEVMRALIGAPWPARELQPPVEPSLELTPTFDADMFQMRTQRQLEHEYGELARSSTPQLPITTLEQRVETTATAATVPAFDFPPTPQVAQRDAVEAFRSSISAATDGMSYEEAEAYLQHIIERQQTGVSTGTEG